jgi:hypothetical protein
MFPECSLHVICMFPALGDSLLARVALHALAFGNARAIGLLWQRVTRHLRFNHWDIARPLPRRASTQVTMLLLHYPRNYTFASLTNNHTNASLPRWLY